MPAGASASRPITGRSRSGETPSRPVPARDGEVGGAQSIRRAMQVLRFVASRPDGARLREVAAASGLNKTTGHRILSALAEEGFLRLDPVDPIYRLGREAEMIGWIARARQDIRALARGGMTRLSAQTGDTVFLSLRSGLEAVCIAREIGDFPIKTLTLEIGSRRPLGVGAGSLALLAFSPPAEFGEILEAIRPRLADYPYFSPERLRRLGDQTRERGYAFNDEGVIHGMCALGVPVLGEDGVPVAALSIAAITARMGPDRRPQIVEGLKTEARLLAQALQTGTSPTERPTTDR